MSYHQYSAIPNVDDDVIKKERFSLVQHGNDDDPIDHHNLDVWNDSGPLKTVPSSNGPALLNRRTPAQRHALTALVGVTWLCMSAFGTFAGGHYIRRALLVGNWTSWELTDRHLYRPFQPLANSLMVCHMSAGVILMLCGPIQLLPYVRRNYLAVHRWTGRLYLICALAASTMATTFVVLYRTSRKDIWEDIGNVIFGTAMMVSTIQSYYHVKVTHDIETHKWWSYRLFCVVFSTVLFRLLMAIYVIALKFIPGYKGTKWIYEALYFAFCLPTWLVLLAYQYFPPPTPPTTSTTTNKDVITAQSSAAQRLSPWMHSAVFFWCVTMVLGLTTMILLIYDWVPSIFGINVGQADGVEHPYDCGGSGSDSCWQY